MAMPKLEIDQVNGRYRVRLDGVDITNAIAANGVRIGWEYDLPKVHLTLVPLELHADLPDAVVRVVQDQPTTDRGGDTELGPGAREFARYLGEMGADVDAIKRRLDGRTERRGRE